MGFKGKILQLNKLLSSREMWDNVPKREAAHRKFRLDLEERALKNLLKDPERLAALRTDWDGLRALKKSLGNALREWKVDLDKAVLKASTPCWDAEDEEKYAASKEPPPQGVPFHEHVEDDPGSSDEPSAGATGSTDRGDLGLGDLPDGAIEVTHEDGVAERLVAVREARLARFNV